MCRWLISSGATLAAAALVLTAAPAAAQDAAEAHAACAMVGWVPAELLQRPLPLRAGTGNARESVSTRSAKAQRFYDQGLDYLHGYVWIEAARSFQQALRHDPGLAMAHVGLSRVHSGLDDRAAAREALRRAEALAGQASARERRRIALRAKQLDAIEELGDAARHQAYKLALDAALAADLEDPELWLLRGNAEEPTAAGRGQRGAAASIAFYHQVLRLKPDDAAAHHYLTHSYETLGQIEAALVHGEAYARLAPAIPHSHHMWGHDLRRVGRIDDAIAAFTRTAELERAYYAAEGLAPHLDWHHVHNLDLLATSYQHKGRMREAERILREAAALAQVTDYVAFNQKALPVFLLARRRWSEALAEAGALSAAGFPVARAVGHALAGHAQLALGRTEEARRSLAEAERELAAAPTLTTSLVSRRTVLPYVDMLRGEMLLREGRTREGRAALEEVVRTFRGLPGPDAWINALFRLESIASTAREVGDWALAEHVAREMVEHDPAYSGGHLALALAAVTAGDPGRAQASFEAAARYWRDADPDLPELRTLRRARE